MQTLFYQRQQRRDATTPAVKRRRKPASTSRPGHSEDDDTPHPLDIALGARVRLRRRELDLSQTELGQATGITFQQIQKYEKGTNRISFSRLVQISEALECSVSDMIGDLDSSKSSNSKTRQVEYLTKAGAAELLAAYAKISSTRGRRAVLNLARAVARDQRESAKLLAHGKRQSD